MATTQIRLPAEMHQFIQQEAARTGVSQNALMLMLMELGKRVYDQPVIPYHFSWEQAPCTEKLLVSENVQSVN